MDEYAKALRTLEKTCGCDRVFSLATVGNGRPFVRCIDACFINGAFYIVTHAASNKARQLAADPAAALCDDRQFSFEGVCEAAGHPLERGNADLRARLTEVFAPWYFKHNDENDPGMLYMRFIPRTGFFHDAGRGWRIDFEKKSAECFDFVPDIIKPTE